MVLKGFAGLSILISLFHVAGFGGHMVRTACAAESAESPDRLMLGFYTFLNKSDIDLISGSPFEYLMPYGTDGADRATLDGYLEHAERNNVKLTFSLKDAYRGTKWYPKNNGWCPTDKETKLISCLVNGVGAHPAVYGWYLADEPTLSLKGNWQRLKTHSITIKNLSAKPIFAHDMPFPRGEMWGYLSKHSDILMPSSYPVPEEKLEKVYDAVEALTSRYENDVIAVVQVFGKYKYPWYKRDKVTGRPPSFDEIKTMSYLALMAGAEGIFYYSLYDIKRLPDSEERLQFLKGLGAELIENYKIIAASEKSPGDYEPHGAEGTYVLIKHWGGKDYLIAVNATEKRQRITVISDKEGDRELELSPLEVRIEPAGVSGKRETINGN